MVAKQGSAQAASMAPADAPSTVRAELGALLRLAVPVSAAFLLNEHQLRGRPVCQVCGPRKQMAAPFCVPGTALLHVFKAHVLPRSHLGPAPLAAASLATSLANVTGYSVMAGLAGATSTLCGQARPWASGRAAERGSAGRVLAKCTPMRQGSTCCTTRGVALCDLAPMRRRLEQRTMQPSAPGCSAPSLF